RGRTGHHRGNHIRSLPDQHEDRSEEIRGSQVRLRWTRGRGGFRGRRALLRRIAFVYFVLLGVLVASSVFAQQRRDGRLLVTVADETGAVIPGATVTVVGQEPATRAAAVAPVTTSDQGIAAVTSLVQGRYMVQAEFPGFAPQVIRDVRVRAGD